MPLSNSNPSKPEIIYIDSSYSESVVICNLAVEIIMNNSAHTHRGMQVYLPQASYSVPGSRGRNDGGSDLPRTFS